MYNKHSHMNITPHEFVILGFEQVWIHIFWLSDKQLYIKLMLLLLLYSEIFRKFLQRWIGFDTISINFC